MENKKKYAQTTHTHTHLHTVYLNYKFKIIALNRNVFITPIQNTDELSFNSFKFKLIMMHTREQTMTAASN